MTRLGPAVLLTLLSGRAFFFRDAVVVHRLRSMNTTVVRAALNCTQEIAPAVPCGEPQSAFSKLGAPI